jgi:hypothetical protein
MGFKSVMKKVGKVALKAAPIAAMFIPGVGPLASMAISAASNAASKKIEGGSWKSALGAGAIGAATGYGAGAIKSAADAAKIAKTAGGLAPSASVGEKIATTAVKAAPKVSALGKVMNGVNTGMNIASPVMSAIQSAGSAPSSGNSKSSSSGIGPTPGVYTPYQPDANSAVNRGRLAGAQDQGFRKGYDVKTRIGEPDEAGTYQTQISRMPKINTDYASMGVAPPRKRKSAINDDGTMKPLPGNYSRTQPVMRAPQAY